MITSVDSRHSCWFHTFSSSRPCCYHRMRQPRNGVRLLAVVLARGIYRLYRIWRVLFLGTCMDFVDFRWETSPHLALLNQSTAYVKCSLWALCLVMDWIRTDNSFPEKVSVFFLWRKQKIPRNSFALFRERIPHDNKNSSEIPGLKGSVENNLGESVINRKDTSEKNSMHELEFLVL